MLNKKAQNMVEYAVLVALVIGAAVAMQTYVKRSLQAKVKDATDANITETLTDANVTLEWKTKQYEPYYATENMINTEKGTNSKQLANQGKTTYSGKESNTIGVGSYRTTLGVDAYNETSE